MVGQQPLSIELPKGTKKNDPTFGITEVHYHQVAAKIQVKPKTSYQVSWQGCSADGLCYPVQRTTLTTDQDGLFPQLQSQKMACSSLIILRLHLQVANRHNKICRLLAVRILIHLLMQGSPQLIKLNS